MKNNFLKNRFFCFLLFFYLLIIESCQYYSYGLDEFLYRDNSIRNRSGKIKDFNNLKPTFLDSDFIDKETSTKLKKYAVLIFTDVHFGAEEKGHNGRRKDDEFLDWIENYQNDTENVPLKFSVCLGDVAEHGLESEFSDYKKFTDKIESNFNLKTYNVVGNHDLYNAGWKNFKDYCFPYYSFYKFQLGEFTYYFLDSASASLGDEQLTSFKRDMEKTEKDRKKIVFMHVPAYAGGLFYFVMQNTTERNKFISFCANNNVIALVDGHTHKEITSNLGFMEHNLSGYLEKRGFAVLTVDESNENAKQSVSLKCYYLE